MNTSLDEPVLAYFGQLVAKQVRDIAIRQWQRSVSTDRAHLDHLIRALVDRLGPDGEELLRQAIPAIVDTAVHQVLFLLEQGDHYGITVSVRTPGGESATILAELSDGLSGDYVAWVPAFSSGMVTARRKPT